MLEGLDSIDWGKISHVYPSTRDEIPKYIRDLLSEDVKTRQGAYSALYGEGSQEYAEMYDSALYIAPFFIELLDYDPTPDKAVILEMLYFWGVTPPTPPTEERISNQVRYTDILEKAEPTFVRLMNDPDVEIRRLAIQVISRFETSLKGVVKAIKQRFNEEPVDTVKLQLLEAIRIFFDPRRLERTGLARRNETWLETIITSQASAEVRMAAARARARCIYLSTSDWLGGKIEVAGIVDLLKDCFFNSLTSESEIIYIYYGYVLDEIAMVGADALASLLEDQRLEPQAAHDVVKIILEHLLPQRKPTSAKIVGQDKDRTRHSLREYRYEFEAIKLSSLWPKKRKIMHAIIDCDPFWQIPTNLFSFFYGLPDDREELRKLVTPE